MLLCCMCDCEGLRDDSRADIIEYVTDFVKTKQKHVLRVQNQKHSLRDKDY